MKANEFIEGLLRCAKKRGDVEVGLLPLKYPNHDTYWFPRLASKGKKLLLIRAGVHGEEVAGPLTLLNHFNEIFDYAHQRNVKLIVYPLGNPSGFELGTRYSVEGSDWEGFAGNNDFVRYRLHDGRWIDAVENLDQIAERCQSVDLPNVKLPKETLLMSHCLESDWQLTNIVGLLDLHQDCDAKHIEPLAFHYSFCNFFVYRSIIEELRKFITIKPTVAATALINTIVKQSDEDGFIICHDGSLSDFVWWYYPETHYNVTVETTGCTPLETAIEVNMIWIRGIIDLIATTTTS